MLDRLFRRLREGKVPEARAVVRELNRQYFRIQNNSKFCDKGIDIFAEDWDSLIILDACRYDAFAARVDLPGSTESRFSRGSMTPEWLRANFANRDLTDTVYVSSNGQFVANNGFGSTLHDFIGVWDESFSAGTRDTSSLASPSAVTKRALEAADKYPRKRLLIHYVQPHLPYLGPTGKMIDSDIKISDFPHEIARNPKVTRETIRRAYIENVDIALDEAAQLLKSLSGKTVVSADHGELLGERLPPLPLAHYGHPRGVYVDPLVQVPWHINTSGERPDIRADPPQSSAKSPKGRSATVERNLADLGYL